MTYKIVADSSADLLTLSQTDFASVPLKITVGETTFVDDENLDVAGMVDTLSHYKGRSVTACPSPEEFQAAFGEADRVFCVTITSNLSGSCNAARIAAREYEAAHPDRKVFVIDTLSAGAEMTLICEKLEELIGKGHSYEEICVQIVAYMAKTKLLFSLQSIRNLANNGRVSPAVAKLVGLLNIRILGKASDEGILENLAKARGDKKAMAELLAILHQLGYQGGRLRIHHCGNLPAAQQLKEKILALHPLANIKVAATRGLCSFYAEAGGLMLGFEIG